MTTPVCGITGAQQLGRAGWSELKNLSDTEPPFRLFRDEGRTFLQVGIHRISLHAIRGQYKRQTIFTCLFIHISLHFFLFIYLSLHFFIYSRVFTFFVFIHISLHIYLFVNSRIFIENFNVQSCTKYIII